MNLKQLFTDDRAVSPVIGVILMVAITVILAAVIGAFVLGLTDNVQSTPQAQFSFEKKGSNDVRVTHKGGDTIDSANLDVVVAGSTNDWPGSGDVSAGTTIGVGNSAPSPNVGTSLNDGDKIQIVYTNPDSDNTAVLAEYTYNA